MHWSIRPCHTVKTLSKATARYVSQVYICITEHVASLIKKIQVHSTMCKRNSSSGTRASSMDLILLVAMILAWRTCSAYWISPLPSSDNYMTSGPDSKEKPPVREWYDNFTADLGGCQSSYHLASSFLSRVAQAARNSVPVYIPWVGCLSARGELEGSEIAVTVCHVIFFFGFADPQSVTIN